MTMPFDRAASEALTVCHEARRRHVYPDKLGKLTVGIGCYLDRGGVPALFAHLGIDFAAVRSGAVDLTDEQIDAIFNHDLNVALAQALADCPTFDDLPSPAQLVLVDMCFQLGGAGVAHFPMMLAAVAQRDWNGAAEQMLASHWATQTPIRCKADAAMMRSCATVDADEIAALLARAQASQVDLVTELDLIRPTGRDRDG